MISSVLSLYNGLSMPTMGFGTYSLPDTDCHAMTLYALKAGYRHLDTAFIYENEDAVGRAIRDSGIPRGDIFLTSKLWINDFYHPLDALDASLKRLHTNYLDLYLLHWPTNKDPEAYLSAFTTLQKAYEDGRIKALGVSNFSIPHFNALRTRTDFIPMVNQVEIHPLFMQPLLRDFCNKNRIVVTAWGPLGYGTTAENPIIQSIAQKHHTDFATVVLNYLLTQNLVVIPKSKTPARITQNLMAGTAITLDDNDIAQLISLDSPHGRQKWDPLTHF